MKVMVLAVLAWIIPGALEATALGQDGNLPASASGLGSEALGTPVPMADVESLREQVGRDALVAQYAALQAMPDVQVSYSALGPVHRIVGSTGIFLAQQGRNLKQDDEAPKILAKFRDTLLAAGSEKLRVRSVSELAGGGQRVIKLDQFIRDIAPPSARGSLDSPGHLVWVVRIRHRDASGEATKQVWVDAITGQLLGIVHSTIAALQHKGLQRVMGYPASRWALGACDSHRRHTRRK